jgi:hypothetical protein
MSRSFVLSAVCAASLSIACSGAFAQSQAKTSKTAAKPAAHAAAHESATENVSSSQLEIAARVLTGDARCEFNQQVGVHPIDGKPGHFRVSFKNVTYTMVPQETTTGAVRLEDKKAGVVWIQIPSKSMMLNSKIGQRMVDGCAQSQQRT